MAKVSAALCLLACLLFSAQAAAVRVGDALAPALILKNAHPSSLRGFLRGVDFSLNDEEDVPGEPVPQCAWNEHDKECGLNRAVALDYIAQVPPSPIKETAFKAVECGLAVTEKDCEVTEGCSWQEGQCATVADLLSAESIRECFGKDVGVFLETPKRVAQCAAFQTADACNSESDCGWFGDEILLSELGVKEMCLFDAWKSLTGLPSTLGHFPLPRASAEIVEERSQVLKQAWGEANQTATEAFLDMDSQVDLPWLPPFTCPEGVNDAVCNIAKGADILLIAEIYCQARFDRDGVCAEDLLCGDIVLIDGEQHCKPVDTGFLSTKLAQFEMFLEAISDPVMRASMRASLLCRQTTSVTGECRKGCVPEPQLCGCYLDPKVVLKQLLDQPVRSGYITCQVVQAIFQTGCMNLETRETCVVKDLCAWDREKDFCTAGPLAYMDVILSNDQALHSEMSNKAFQCGQITTMDECNSFYGIGIPE